MGCIIRKENVKLTPELAWQNYLERTNNNQVQHKTKRFNTINKDKVIIKEKINTFLDKEIDELQEEGSFCLEMCEEEGDFHMVSYWINGTYENVAYFLQNNYCSTLLEVVVELYPNNIDELKTKIELKYGQVTDERIAYEALSSILLNLIQYYPEWYTVYGCEESDMIDFDKYNVNQAITNTNEFPVIKSSDIVSAMLGVNDKVQPSDMYDIFAHYADILKFKDKKKAILYDESEEDLTFTPDPFLSAAVVARYKRYQDMQKTFCSSDMACDFANLMLIDNDEVRNSCILHSGLNDYKIRFSEAPYGLPLHDKMISGNIIHEEGVSKFLISYCIRGVKDFNVSWDHIADIIYDIPRSCSEYQSFIIKMSVDFKRELNGLEKVRNKDIAAVEGKYPTKYSATHGLTFVKDINTHYKDSRGNDCRKAPQPRYNLNLAEKQALYIIKKSFRYGINNSFISCSFGIDSMTTLHLTRRVNKYNYKIIFNNSHVEYPQLIKYKRKMVKEWQLEDKIVETHPVESYWSIQKRQGWNFERKGDRRSKGANKSEECCNKIKHIPFYNFLDQMIKENTPIQIDFSGLRAMESRTREQQCKRDGLVYLAKNWKCIRVNPIAFFSDEMVWEYQKKYNMPYCEIYDMKVYYEDVYDNITEEEEGKIYYSARCGCMPCMVNSSRGYLFFLRKFFKPMYNYMMYDLGLVVTLFERGGKKIGILSNDEDVKNKSKQLSLFDYMEETAEANGLSNKDILENYPLEMMEEMILRRPCKFL